MHLSADKASLLVDCDAASQALEKPMVLVHYYTSASLPVENQLIDELPAWNPFIGSVTIYPEAWNNFIMLSDLTFTPPDTLSDPTWLERIRTSEPTFDLQSFYSFELLASIRRAVIVDFRTPEQKGQDEEGYSRRGVPLSAWLFDPVSSLFYLVNVNEAYICFCENLDEFARIEKITPESDFLISD